MFDTALFDIAPASKEAMGLIGEEITFEDGSVGQVTAQVFEDGSFVCSTDESARWAWEMSRKVHRWARKGKTDKLQNLFDGDPLVSWQEVA